LVSLHAYKEAPEGSGDFRIGEQVSGTVKHGDDLVLLGNEVVLLGTIDGVTEIGTRYGMGKMWKKPRW
jgi:hypothetical protein